MTQVFKGKVINIYLGSLNLLIIAFLLSVCISCDAQEAKPTVKILNGPAFKLNKTISYEISSPTPIYYYISVEKLLDNNWREIVLDISSSAPDGGAIINKTAVKHIKGVYQLKNIPIIYRNNGNRFRLKVSYGLTPSTVKQVIVSNEFRTLK